MKQIFVYILLFLFVACSKDTGLQNGDLLFVGECNGNLSGAISRVTQTELKTNYSHIAIVEISDANIFVLDASPNGGTRKLTLLQFIEIESECAEISVFRLKKEYKTSISEALVQANSMLGKPYNFSYVINDSAHYCSEFIYKAFIADSIFTLAPMSFINPATNTFDSTWVKFYNKLKIPIPEGEPGCNPNGLANSTKIEYFQKLDKHLYNKTSEK